MRYILYRINQMRINQMSYYCIPKRRIIIYILLYKNQQNYHKQWC